MYLCSCISSFVCAEDYVCVCSYCKILNYFSRWMERITHNFVSQLTGNWDIEKKKKTQNTGDCKVMTVKRLWYWEDT